MISWVDHFLDIAYDLSNMPYMLIAGIIFVGVPIIVIEILAIVLFIGFVNDDSDAKGLLTLAIISVLLGAAFLGAHFTGISFS